MKVNKGTIVLFLLLAIAWLMVTSSVDLGEVIAGGIVVIVVVLAVGRHRYVFSGARLSVRAVVFTPVYLAKFLWHLVRANIDVARRVLSPSLPIRPGIVRARATLSSDLGKFILANSITLTPGTLTLDVEADQLFIHWIDVKGESCDEATREIVTGFETTLKEVVE